ncbi:MAG TPA: RDD family protein [Firmicutes bacterium]|nr:RDD family protein [Bacillota bacterium]
MKTLNEMMHPEYCEFCSFWRRIGAFIIDMFILIILGFILSLVLGDFFSEIGAWGRFIGFTISILYFGIMDSSISGGQTLGKMITKIRVVNILGENVNVIRCVFRASIILVPFFLYGIMMPPSAFASAAMIVITFMFLSMLVGLAYFYIFNVRTKQSFHDIAAGTYVVRKSMRGKLAKSEHVSRNVPVVHFIVYLALLAVILAVSLFADYTVKKPFMEQGVSYQNVIRTNSAIMDYEEVYYSTIITGKGNVAAVDSEVVYLEAAVYIYKRGLAGEENARKIRNVIMNTYAAAPNLDYIEIIFMHGFDIGIASRWKGEAYQFVLK